MTFILSGFLLGITGFVAFSLMAFYAGPAHLNLLKAGQADEYENINPMPRNSWRVMLRPAPDLYFVFLFSIEIRRAFNTGAKNPVVGRQMRKTTGSKERVTANLQKMIKTGNKID
jgi:hypothetical protein